MQDPLSEVIALLQPKAVFAKAISGAGSWGVRYSAFDQPSFCVVLEGGCRLAVDGAPPVALEAGDFVLLPTTPGFTMSGGAPSRPVLVDPKRLPSVDDVRHGTRTGRPDVRLLGGYFAFDSPDAALLVSLLPPLVHVRGLERLSLLVGIVAEEAAARRSGRDLVLTRLVEVLLVEALRSTSPDQDAPPGLLRGLSDGHLAPAIRRMHAHVARSYTVADLAKLAGLSRSAFFDRFTRVVGLPPMEYLLAWRMAVAKDLLRRHELGLAEVAARVGYGSASSFSTAFSRHVGRPPSQFAA